MLSVSATGENRGEKAKIYPSTFLAEYMLPVIGPFVNPSESPKVLVNDSIGNLRTQGLIKEHTMSLGGGGHNGGYHDRV